jgi:hypothetical protein
MAATCLNIWCIFLLYLSFSLNDLAVIGLLVIAMAWHFTNNISYQQDSKPLILLAGVTLGKFVLVLFGSVNRESSLMLNTEPGMRDLIIGLITLLAISSSWPSDLPSIYYNGRWTGPWDSPNTYGILMGTGVLLAAGVLMQRTVAEYNMSKWQSISLCAAAGMMLVGLVMSYSRGAWFGTAVGFLYLGKHYGKFKWQFVLLGILIVLMVVLFFWKNTSTSAPWIIKRLDLGRPSAQHRLTAWEAGLEIMRDHPLGVGWHNTISVYQKNYSPPENGVAAITTNDFLMIGTQLGIPALLCFVGYIYQIFKIRPLNSARIACRAGALAMLVAFWFDGGVFKLATASVFWILLELGRVDMKEGKLTKAHVPDILCHQQ